MNNIYKAMLPVLAAILAFGVINVIHYNYSDRSQSKPPTPQTTTEYAKAWCDSKGGIYYHTAMYGHSCTVNLTKGRFNNGRETYQIGYTIIDYDSGEIEVTSWLQDSPRSETKVIGRFIHKGGDYWK